MNFYIPRCINDRKMCCKPFSSNLMHEFFNRQSISLERPSRAPGEEEINGSRELTAAKPRRRGAGSEQRLIDIMVEHLAAFREIETG